MNSKQIEYVLEIVKTNNFNKATENLYVSQPTMTYQVKALEDEIGFAIFERSSKGTVLTLAGEQFVSTLRDIQNQLRKAIEQGQNFSSSFSENIRIMTPIRSALYLLPNVMKIFKEKYPSILITPNFDLYHSLQSFLNHEQDIVLAYGDQIKSIKDIHVDHLYTAHFYLVTTWDDPLSKKEIIQPNDLQGRTLMIGGSSQPPLRALQQRLIQTVPNLSYFNSHDHDTSLTNVAAKNAIVISPGYLNDYTNQFAWIPFDCEETIEAALCTHPSDTRQSVQDFKQLLIDTYKNTNILL